MMDYTGNNNGNMTTNDGRLIRLTDGAYPTSAKLSSGGEQWAANAILEGTPVTVFFQFDEDEVQASEAACPDNPAEELPWGIEHVTHWTVTE